MDGDEASREALTRVLSTSGYVPIAARSVDDARAVLQDRRHPPPAAVVVHLSWSTADHLRLVRELRRQEASRAAGETGEAAGPRRLPPRVPVLVVGGQLTPQERLAALEAGADDVLTKPVAPSELLACVRRHLQARRTEGEAYRRAARLRALHDASLLLAAPVAATPEAVASLLGSIISGAVACLGGRDGRLVLADDPAWQDLVPGTDPADGLIRVEQQRRLHRVRWRPDETTQHVLATGELLAISHTLVGDGFGPYPHLAERGIGSFVLAPLRAGGRTLGVLTVSFREPGELDDEDREVLELFAAHAAMALERVRLLLVERERQAQTARLVATLAQQEAEAAALRDLDRLKNELLSTVSHELRTPLTVIYGYAQRLQARATVLDAATIAEMGGRIQASAARLKRLIDDLLDFASLERQALRLQLEPFDLVALLREVVAGFRQQPGGRRLQTRLPTHLPVYADRARVAQVVSNLLVNALTYALTGRVTVRAMPDGTVARVEVRDRGPGIAPEEQARVWQKFVRGTQVARFDLAPGSGIGLALVKALVEAQGGRVGLESTPGRGACFWFELPLSAAPVSPASPAAPIASTASASE